MSSKTEIIDQLKAAVTSGRTDILRSIISAVEKGTCTCGNVRISSVVMFSYHLVKYCLIMCICRQTDTLVLFTLYEADR